MGGGYLLVKAQGDPLSLAPGLRAQIAKIDPDQPVSKLATLDDFILETFWLIKVLGSIFTAFGLSALFLAAVGLYGVMANSVTQRTREMGVRRALGAEGHHILALVLAAGLRQVVLGMALGGGWPSWCPDTWRWRYSTCGPGTQPPSEPSQWCS
jgi:predicted lysophospholipase L1 biosynthesis ABC-type transport system permease subunit